VDLSVAKTGSVPPGGHAEKPVRWCCGAVRGFPAKYTQGPLTAARPAWFKSFANSSWACNE
jgi:hypothetical protein